MSAGGAFPPLDFFRQLRLEAVDHLPGGLGDFAFLRAGREPQRPPFGLTPAVQLVLDDRVEALFLFLYAVS